MKLRILVIALLQAVFCSLKLSAQSPPPDTINVNNPGVSVQEVLNQIHAVCDSDSSEGGPRSHANFLEAFWRDRAVINDSTTNDTTNMFSKYLLSLHDAIGARLTSSCGSSGFQGNWSLLGPDTIDGQYMGEVYCVWTHPTDTNYILAGTLGGLFRTKDGGHHWKCITDNSFLAGGIVGVTSIAVDPNDTNIIYLGTENDPYFNLVPPQIIGLPTWSNWGAGLLKTSDGGDTWTQEKIPYWGSILDDIEAVQKVFISPDGNSVYAFVGNKIKTRSLTGTTWYDITPSDADNNIFWELQFVPDGMGGYDPNHFFVSTATTAGAGGGIWETNSGNPFIKITTATQGFNSLTVGSYTGGENDFVRFSIQIPVSDTLYALAMINDHDAGYTAPNSYNTGLFTYCISAGHWYPLNSNLPIANNINSIYRSELAVSNASTSNNSSHRNIYFGNADIYQSYDGGTNFYSIGTYDGQTHGDIRGFYLQSATNTQYGYEDRLYAATDGGVSEKPKGRDAFLNTTSTTININGRGLSCGQFWSVATSEEGGLVAGGMMHDGFEGYESNQLLQWKHLNTGDGSAATFDNDDRTIAYNIDLLNSSFVESVSGGSRTMDSKYSDSFPSDHGNFNLPMVNVGSNHYLGMTDLENENGRPFGSWNPIASTYGLPTALSNPISSEVRTMALSPYEDKVGYIVYNLVPGTTSNTQDFYYRPSGSGSGVNFSIGVTPNSNFPITNVTMDPTSPGRVWVAMGDNDTHIYTGGNQNRVFYSESYGTTGTWKDVSYGLPAHVPVTAIIYQEGSNLVYCATDAGIYKCDMSSFNSTHSTSHYDVEWTCFNKGIAGGLDFPNCMVTQLNINYCEQKLYAATYGRSVWSTDLYLPNTVEPFTTDINSNTTWSTEDLYETGSIKVESGKTLTISGGITVHMPKNGRIAVDKGGKLIVDGATITNDCQNCFWQGIEAWGDSSKNQNGTNQGTVIIKNHSFIKHANVGFANWNLTDSATSLTTTGGIIQCVASSFIDN